MRSTYCVVGNRVVVNHQFFPPILLDYTLSFEIKFIMCFIFEATEMNKTNQKHHKNNIRKTSYDILDQKLLISLPSRNIKTGQF